jgi:hypothetical protein
MVEEVWNTSKFAEPHRQQQTKTMPATCGDEAATLQAMSYLMSPRQGQTDKIFTL